MSCNGCYVKFNFFHKETTCANCGLSFCSKCLKQKCRIPNRGNNELNVCKPCYSKLAAGTSNPQNIVPPPDAFLKTEPITLVQSSFQDAPNIPFFVVDSLIRRLENLENPSAPPITIYQQTQQNSKLQKLRTGLAPQDIQILERLERLREDRKKTTPPTESEIRARLANLRGENPYVEEPKKPFPIDTRTDQQKSDALLEQFISERDIELAHNPQEDIEARIACLREQGVRPNENSYMDNLHDSSSSEEEVDRIARKIMSEVKLDQKASRDIIMSDDMEEADFQIDSFELPWCVLCNNDASVQCLDCGGDLYCQSCSTEVHRKSDTDHRIVPFKPKTNT